MMAKAANKLAQKDRKTLQNDSIYWQMAIPFTVPTL